MPVTEMRSKDTGPATTIIQESDEALWTSMSFTVILMAVISGLAGWSVTRTWRVPMGPAGVGAGAGVGSGAGAGATVGCGAAVGVGGGAASSPHAASTARPMTRVRRAFFRRLTRFWFVIFSSLLRKRPKSQCIQESCQVSLGGGVTSPWADQPVPGMVKGMCPAGLSSAPATQTWSAPRGW